LLYTVEEIRVPELTIKVIGHQWYWSYEATHVKMLDFKTNKWTKFSSSIDSYMVPDEEL
jgi:cytochrome c oxidase subunit 2